MSGTVCASINILEVQWLGPLHTTWKMKGKSVFLPKTLLLRIFCSHMHEKFKAAPGTSHAIAREIQSTPTLTMELPRKRQESWVSLIYFGDKIYFIQRTLWFVPRSCLLHDDESTGTVFWGVSDRTTSGRHPPKPLVVFLCLCFEVVDFWVDDTRCIYGFRVPQLARIRCERLRHILLLHAPLHHRPALLLHMLTPQLNQLRLHLLTENLAWHFFKQTRRQQNKSTETRRGETRHRASKDIATCGRKVMTSTVEEKAW